MNILAWLYRDRAAVCMVVDGRGIVLSAFLFIEPHCKLVLCYACGFKVRSCLLFYCFSGLLCMAQWLFGKASCFYRYKLIG